jgi:hypothetical protein
LFPQLPDLAELFQKLIEQHRVDGVVADGVRLSFFIGQHQARDLPWRLLGCPIRGSSAFTGAHNETLSVAAMRLGNPDCSRLGING